MVTDTITPPAEVEFTQAQLEKDAQLANDNEALLEPKNKEFTMYSNDILYLANGLQPIGVEQIELEGEQANLDVLCRIHQPAEGKKPEQTILFTRDSSSSEAPIMAMRVHQQGDHTVADRYVVLGENPNRRLKTQRGTVGIGSDPKIHRGWLGLQVQATWGTPATVTVSEAAHPGVETWSERNDRAASIRRWKRGGALVLAILAGKGVIGPGGLHDRILDPSHNSYDYVKDQFYTADDIPTKGEIRDGNHFEREELLDDPTLGANERLAQTMGDLDEHRFDRVRRHADEFAERNKDNLLDQKQIKELEQKIDAATSTDEVLEILDKFMSRYEASATISDQIPVDEHSSDGFRDKLKHGAKATVQALGPLPRQLVHSGLAGDGYSTGIEFAYGVDFEGSDPLYGKAVAYWDGIHIVLLGSGQVDLGMGTITIYDLRDSILHEFGHSLDDAGFKLNPDRVDRGLQGRIENLFSEIFSHPKFVTDYATKNPGEENADTTKQVLEGDVENPDHVGKFESRANLGRLQILAQLEARWPGITAYLIAHQNPDLLS